MVQLSEKRLSWLRLPIFPTPLKAGAGFKHEHLDDILRDRDGVGFFEVHAENFMSEGGPNLALLDRIAETWPLSIHGVALSLGGAGPLGAPSPALAAWPRSAPPGGRCRLSRYWSSPY